LGQWGHVAMVGRIPGLWHIPKEKSHGVMSGDLRSHSISCWSFPGARPIQCPVFRYWWTSQWEWAGLPSCWNMNVGLFCNCGICHCYDMSRYVMPGLHYETPCITGRKIHALVNSVMKLGVPQNLGNFFTSWGIISSQGLFHGVTLVSCNSKHMQSTTMKILDTGDLMPGSLQTYTFSVLQVFDVALQKSYRSQVGLHCTIIRLRWQYPLKMAVCQCLYTLSCRGSQIFRLSNSQLQTLGARNMTKQVPYWAPKLWSDRSHSLLFGASCRECELNAFIISYTILLFVIQCN
jgi:hypothetical protein